MEMERLIVNIGSSSKKYALFVGDEQVFACHFERENNGFLVSIVREGYVEKEEISEEVFKKACVHFLELYKKYFGEKTISTLGIRVVAPGDYFQKHRVIDEEFLERLHKAKALAPLHIHATLEEITLLKEVFPETKLVAASDSAFHSDMPSVARSYGLPLTLTESDSVKRFGYHGLSVSSVAQRLQHHLGGVLPEKIIVLHLGAGCSVTALKNGKTVDTSMGFTPLEGLVMSTRSGSFDPSIIFSLLEQGKTKEEIENIVNKQSGLFGLSGMTSDMREIIALKNEGNVVAGHAFDIFVYQIIKYIGAYSLVLGGVDAIVFTGTIGERSFIVRERVVRDISSFFVGVNKEVNDKEDGSLTHVSLISDELSQVRVFVVPADESKAILQAMSTC